MPNTRKALTRNPFSMPLGIALGSLSLAVACSSGGGDQPDGEDGSSSSGGSNNGGGGSSGSESTGGSSSGSNSGGSGTGGGSVSGSGSGVSQDAGNSTGDGGGSDGGQIDGQAGVGVLNPSLPPGKNFDLSHWLLQEPDHSTQQPSTLVNGHSDSFFYTDTDGSMTFFSPEQGSNGSFGSANRIRSELREVAGDNQVFEWDHLIGMHTLAATVNVSECSPTVSKVTVGQIHVGINPDGTTTNTFPIVELFYHCNGDIEPFTDTPAGGGGVPQGVITTVDLGKTWSYIIAITGHQLTATIVDDQGAMFVWRYTVQPGFDNAKNHFKAECYNQAGGSSTTSGGHVHFYALNVVHM